MYSTLVAILPDTAYIGAISGLVIAIGMLWREQLKDRAKCDEGRQKCEEDRDRLWAEFARVRRKAETQ